MTETDAAPMAGSNEELPWYLLSTENFLQHLDEQFGDDTSQERGRRFVHFVQRVVPQLPEATRFPAPEINPKETHDGGFDLLTAVSDNGKRLYIQSKFKLRSVDELDLVFSKFKQLDASVQGRPLQLSLGNQAQVGPTSHYMLITSSNIGDILRRYEMSQRGSIDFYRLVSSEHRVFIIDVRNTLKTMQVLYRRTFSLPDTLTLVSEPGWLASHGVYMGVLQGRAVAELYELYGDGLFFENIRDFLGYGDESRSRTDRESVNTSIQQTITEAPDKLLARNNGITLRASQVTIQDDITLLSKRAAIVNGCQTTMSLYHSSPVSSECMVPVKVVETNDAWEVARAANYENHVGKVDLDLARYLRPQLVQKFGAVHGYSIETTSGSNVVGILEQLHTARATYEEMKALYIGVFSRRPNNLWADNYTELRSDVLQELSDEVTGAPDDEIFRVLFAIIAAGRDALNRCENAFKDFETYRRFQERDRYRAYLEILALAALLPDNLKLGSKFGDPVQEAARLREFLKEADRLISRDRSAFILSYVNPYQALAATARSAPKSELVPQEMWGRISQAPFDALVEDVRMRNRADEAKRGL